jgi:hypothetical protein
MDKEHFGSQAPRLGIVYVFKSAPIRGKFLPFPDPHLSALISGKVLLLLFRSRAITAITRDHPISFPILHFLHSSVFQRFWVSNLGNLPPDPRSSALIRGKKVFFSASPR